jgi:type III secretion protein K
MTTSSPKLAGLIRQFNLAPAGYVDASWLPAGWSARYADAESLHGRTAAALSRWLLQQHGLADQFDFDFAAREKRLALLDVPALRTLARYLGLAHYAPYLRRVVAREARSTLMQRIGGPGYAFLLNAALLPTHAGTPTALDAHADDFDTRLLHAGAGALLASLPGPASALRRRVQLKLPRAAAHSPAAPVAEAAGIRTLIFTRLIPAVAPQWLWLF